MISVWGRSSKSNAIEKSEEYFQRLRELEFLAAEDSGVRVDARQATVVEHTALIQAWAYHVAKHVEDSRRAVDRVDELLDELMERHFSRNFDGGAQADLWKPNRLTFASVFRTIGAALRIPNRGDRAKATLEKMERLSLKPDAHILSLAEKCWRHSNKGGKKQKKKQAS
jgi:hypothetical protein